MVKYNPLGFWVSDSGKLYMDEGMCTEIKPEIDNDGYKFITDKDGKRVYIHRIVVFTYGDCNGREYDSKGRRCIIDHLDMRHAHNAVSNLQLVSHGINLFRAYYKTKYPETEKRFKDYYNSLDNIDKMILNFEIQADIEGRY